MFEFQFLTSLTNFDEQIFPNFHSWYPKTTCYERFPSEISFYDLTKYLTKSPFSKSRGPFSHS